MKNRAGIDRLALNNIRKCGNYACMKQILCVLAPFICPPPFSMLSQTHDRKEEASEREREERGSERGRERRGERERLRQVARDENSISTMVALTGRRDGTNGSFRVT